MQTLELHKYQSMSTLPSLPSPSLVSHQTRPVPHHEPTIAISISIVTINYYYYYHYHYYYYYYYYYYY